MADRFLDFLKKDAASRSEITFTVDELMCISVLFLKSYAATSLEIVRVRGELKFEDIAAFLSAKVADSPVN